MNDQVSQKILKLHEELRFWWTDLCRIAIALYDPGADTLSTFVSSNDRDNPLTHYQAQLEDVPSLQKIAAEGQPRIIDNLRTLADSGSHHTQSLLAAGVLSSYTVPVYSSNQELTGFLFFNSDQTNYFNQELVHHLDIYAQLLIALLEAEISPIKVLSAAVYTAKRFTSWRDEETGEHLARVSHYSRLIANGLHEKKGLSDEYIEFLFQFAPMHDIGKITIPDKILLKPGPLDRQERDIMNTHVSKGVEIVDQLVESFSLHGVTHVEIMRNIVHYHHERWDGKGYLQGLSGEEIPLEARIVALADCFDALLSERPYKPAWSFEKTKGYLREQSGRHFDPACVDALLIDQAQIHSIRERFADKAT